MSVIIPNMKMPMSCLVCPLAREMFGCLVCVGYFKDRLTGRRVYKSDLKESDADFNRPDWCPIVFLPEGHGDLIDRDALKKRTPMVIDYSAGGFGTDGSIRPVRGYGDWQIDQAPTIVPAEGGNADGNP